MTGTELRQATDAYVRDCLSRVDPPQVNELARRLGFSASQFSRFFVRAVGVLPCAYLQGAQITRAKQLLRDTTLPVSVVGMLSGYPRRVTFFRSFKRIVGLTPNQFRHRPS